MTDKPPRPSPPPLTPAQKWGFTGCLIGGIVVLIIGFVFVPDDAPDLLHGAVFGAGASLTAIGALMLFYRPDRGPGAKRE